MVDGGTYETAEHWMMAQKALVFDNQEMYEAIIAAPSPASGITHQKVFENSGSEVRIRGGVEFEGWYRFFTFDLLEHSQG